MKRKKIRLFFSDFWKGFDKNNNFFLDLLSEQFDIEISNKPDFLIHSVYSKEFLKFNGIRICYTGENTRPDFSLSDYHIGFDNILSKNYLRWPIFLIMTPPKYLVKNESFNEIKNNHSKFAAFVYSNYKAKERIEFFHKLSTYKKVDSGGKVLNNIGYLVDDKVDFISKYKFTFAFENEKFPGYTTEKITHSMKARSIPIYWGDPEVEKYFNPKSFINVDDFDDFKEAIEYIKEVDMDERLYKKIVNEPYLYNNKIPFEFETERLIEFFDCIFSQKGLIKPVAKSIHKYYYYSNKIVSKLDNLKNRVLK